MVFASQGHFKIDRYFRFKCCFQTVWYLFRSTCLKLSIYFCFILTLPCSSYQSFNFFSPFHFCIACSASKQVSFFILPSALVQGSLCFLFQLGREFFSVFCEFFLFYSKNYRIYDRPEFHILKFKVSHISDRHFLTSRWFSNISYILSILLSLYCHVNYLFPILFCRSPLERCFYTLANTAMAHRWVMDGLPWAPV